MGKWAGHIDWITVLLFIILSSFGVFLLVTADNALFVQQALYLGAGLILFFLCSKIHSAVLTWFAPIGYILANILLLVSYFGPQIRGATRWIIIAGVQIQPSELAKPFLLLFFAWLCVQFPPRDKKNIPLHLIAFVIPFLLVIRQPDLGTGLVYAGFWLGIMIAAGLSLALVAVIVLFITVCMPWIWYVLADYQKSRILTFLNPGLDPRGAGYNALQSTITVGSGQLFGRGLGMGTQSHLRFLPEYHTDFIFAFLIEELGFIGGIMLLTLYTLLLFRLIQFAFRKTAQPLGYIYTLGVVSMILVQIFVNVGMNMGILPITGITLPFVSYGGSSLLSLSISLGILMSFREDRGDAKSVAIT